MKTLFDFVSEIKGCQFATIETLTSLDKLPKKLGLGVVTKHSKRQVQINYSYQNAVNNRLQKQGNDNTFQTEPLRWGQWVKGQENKIITHNGEYYLRVYTYKGASVQNTYFVNGNLATAEQVKIITEWEKSQHKPSARQAENGLTENQVQPSSPKFSNILSLKVNNEIWSKQDDLAIAV